MSAPSIAVIGGGISGLSSAFFIKRYIPNAAIDVYEASNRTGGWIQSKLHKSNMFIENGPRTVHINKGSIDILDMIRDIGMSNSLKFISIDRRSTAMAIDGQVYPFNILGKKFLFPMLKGLAIDFFSTRGVLEDETTHDFITRKAGAWPAEIMFSALTKGIVAGDSRRISVKCVQPKLFELDQAYGSISRGSLIRYIKKKINPNQQETNDEYMNEILKNEVIFGMKNGMESLCQGLESYLSRKNVRIFKDAKVEQLRYSQGQVKVSSPSAHRVQCYDKVISSVPSFSLSRMLQDEPLQNALNSIEYVDVGIVNLIYNDSNVKQSLPHFGFLCSSTEDTPVLGCINNSHIFGWDSSATNFCVLLGGFLFEKYFGRFKGEELEKVIFGTAIQEISKYLNIPSNVKPISASLNIQRKCIPQYYLGHEQRIKDIVNMLNDEYDGNLLATGCWKGGVSLRECVSSSKVIAEQIAQEFRDSSNDLNAERNV